MTTNDIRKQVANNQLQQALNACEQLELNDDFKSKLIALKATYREYNNHRMDGDMRNDDLEIMRAGLTKKVLIFLSEFEIVCLRDFKTDFVELTRAIEQNAQVSETAEAAHTEIVKEANSISEELNTIDNAEKKEDIKPGLIQRVGDFLAKFGDKNSTQGKLLINVKDGVGIVQQLGKRYNSIAQWFALPQIPTVFL